MASDTYVKRKREILHETERWLPPQRTKYHSAREVGEGRAERLKKRGIERTETKTVCRGLGRIDVREQCHTSKR